MALLNAPLSVSGGSIMDAGGNRVRLAGVNWGGAHQNNLVPAGLDQLHRDDISARIAGWGLNHVRLPFALGTFMNNNGTLKTAPVPVPASLAANPDLAGATPWEVYQACVTSLTAAGLAVIPNQHLLFQGWPAPVTTQILTRHGWKFWHEVEPGIDQTLGRADDGTLQWTPVLQVRTQADRSVVRIGTTRWSTICTPDHRWLTQEAFPRNDRPVEWGPVKAESAQVAWGSKRTLRGIAGTRRLVLTGYAEGGKSECTPDEARLIAWILGDGNLTIRRNGVSYQAYIAQSASKHAAEIRALVLRTGVLSSEVMRNTGHGREVCLFRLKNLAVRELWRHLNDGLLPFVLSLGQEARAAWLDVWRKAEGSAEAIYQNPGDRQEAIALTAFLEGYLPQRIDGARHKGVTLGTRSVNNGPNTRWIYENAGLTDVWCPTTGLGSWVARDEDGRIFLTGNCCSQADCNGLWYNGSWPASTFNACWEMVADEFASVPLVIGYDLHNEPRPAAINGTVVTPTWGDGNPGADMRLLYANIIARIQPAAPGKLWFCEGLNYASDLTGAAAHPVGPAGTVYSLHDYAWFHAAGQSATSYYNQMDAAGGYLPLSGQAPLWIGEFGTDTGTISNMTTGWMKNFLSWAQARAVHWCWWELSATAVLGLEPVTNVVKAVAGNREGYGLAAGQDWLGSETQVLELLQPLM